MSLTHAARPPNRVVAARNACSVSSPKAAACSLSASTSIRSDHRACSAGQATSTLARRSEALSSISGPTLPISRCAAELSAQPTCWAVRSPWATPLRSACASFGRASWEAAARLRSSTSSIGRIWAGCVGRRSGDCIGGGLSKVGAGAGERAASGCVSPPAATGARSRRPRSPVHRSPRAERAQQPALLSSPPGRASRRTHQPRPPRQPRSSHAGSVPRPPALKRDLSRRPARTPSEDRAPAAAPSPQAPRPWRGVGRSPALPPGPRIPTPAAPTGPGPAPTRAASGWPPGWS